MRYHRIICFVLCWVYLFTHCVTGYGQKGKEKKHRQPVVVDSSVFFYAWMGGQHLIRRNTFQTVQANRLGTVFNVFDSTFQPSSPIMMGVLLPAQGRVIANGGDIKSYTKYFASWVAPDSTPATFFAFGIDEHNYKDYQYHVILNDSIELIPWSPVPVPQLTHGAKKPFAHLGTYHYPGFQVLVEVANTKDYQLRDGIVVDWRPLFKPAVTEVYITGIRGSYNIHHKNYADYVSLFDTTTGLPLDLRMPEGAVTSIGINFGKHEAHPLFSAFIKGTDTTILSRDSKTNNITLNGYRYATPGHYELIVCRQSYATDFARYSQYILRMPFDVYETKTIVNDIFFKKVLPYLLGGLLLISVSFAWYYRRNRQKLKQAAYRQQLKQVQLQSIRSQLNPHFVFNALSSIRHLVHKHDVHSAEDYLTRFATLTRAILDTSEDELISLEDELKMLGDYLQMEQLRYPFEYTITVDKGIHITNTEIPAMLLQPMVENAVKHGVSALDRKGKIDITVKRMEKTLELTVHDNGKGFDHKVSHDHRKHKGLWLSQERIRLLNETYGSEVVSMGLFFSGKGTMVIITLKNWLS